MKIYFFTFIILCTLSLSSAIPVRDVDKNLLRSGTNYYILPVNRGKGGGITLSPGRPEPCPYDVAQENNEKSNGLPINFVPANSTKDNIIHEPVDLNVVFSVVGKCLPTPVWRVESNFEQGAERKVSSHGMVSIWTPKNLNNWFKIEKYENHYKMRHCPAICKDCCADIGSSVVAKNGPRVLVLNNVPLKVMFKKA